MFIHILALLLALIDPPADPATPLEPVPSARQLAWHALEYCAFVHFNMNTFTSEEWGTGKEDPASFAPTALDCNQWARVAKQAGMKGIILTAKHHDGFCLWPSRHSDHTVAASRWRDGKGDVLRELSQACREQGLKLGVYLSPWDRHSPLYGESPRYNQYFADQLREVLSSYGEIFEVWFDGACGEGENGKRQVYDWPLYIDTVRKLQPNAVIFSDAGPDIRWVGNERGFAGETNWGMLRRGEFFPGIPNRESELNEGQQDGTHWVPAECDVSIRPGWYYRASEDERVKTLAELIDIYFASVGRNGSLLLNLPVDRRGLVHERDAARLMELRRWLDATFATDAARGGNAKASDQVEGHAALAVSDGDEATFWLARGPGASLELKLATPSLVDVIELCEALALGQRVAAFSVAGETKDGWRPLATGTTIGHKRLLRIPRVELRAVRLTIARTRADSGPAITTLGLYRSAD